MNIPPKKIEKKMKEIISSLNKWSYEYWVLDQPSVTDAVYDKNLKELEELEKEYNFVFPNSPTSKIGHSINQKFHPVERQIPMLSLDSVNNHEDLLKFDERVKKILKTEQEINYVCEWKIDGLSVSLIYQNHHLTQISTRGDGIIGEDITFNKNLIKNIPFFLKEISNCEVRGEVYMKKDEFFRLNKELEKNNFKVLANPRNAAAGTLRTLIPSQERSLLFFAYQLLNDVKVKSQLECLEKLEKLGFEVSPHYRLIAGIKKVQKFIEKQEKLRDKLDFESDGIVIKVNDYSDYEKLGQTSKFPRWALAYKFLAFTATSQIKGIYTEVSRSGRITYVAEISPLIIQGSKISKVTLHNYAFIRNLSLNIGDEVLIKRAGDVIPQIIQITKKNSSALWLPHHNCPSCNSNLLWNSTKIYQICTNNDCPQKVINFLTHFASQNGLDIKGISQKLIAKLYKNDLLKVPTDFYQLCQKKEELLKLEGLKEKSVENILTAIDESKKKPLTNLLAALGIPLLSSVKAKKITKFYPDLSSLLTAMENNNEWEKIKEILGEETQKELKNYFQKLENKKLIKRLNIIFQPNQKNI